MPGRLMPVLVLVFLGARERRHRWRVWAVVWETVDLWIRQRRRSASTPHLARGNPEIFALGPHRLPPSGGAPACGREPETRWMAMGLGMCVRLCPSLDRSCSQSAIVETRRASVATIS